MNKQVNQIDIVAALHQGAEILYQSETSQVVYLAEMPCFYLDINTEQEWDIAIKLMNEYEEGFVVLHQVNEAKRIRNLHIEMACFNVMYMLDTIEVIPSAYPICLLELKDVDAASLMYTSHEQDEYIKERIAAKQVWGAFDEEKLVGMIGVHSEGSMGMLEVHPDYRRHHLAMALESFLIDKQLKKGVPAFAQVVTTNEASLALQRKLNLMVGTQEVAWGWREKE